MRIAVCDDIKETLDFLCSEIDRQFTENKIEHTIEAFERGGEFLSAHENQPFDIVFLDIVMPDLDGFQVAKQIRVIAANTYIIFVTTESSMVYDSLDFQPFHFIPKSSPELLRDRLSHVIKKLIIHLSAKQKIELKLPYGETRFVEPDAIVYINSSANYSEFVLDGGEKLKIRKKLDEVMNELNPYIFARIHKSFAVNMKFVKRVNFKSGDILLSNGETLNASRTYKNDFEAVYSRYIRSFE